MAKGNASRYIINKNDFDNMKLLNRNSKVLIRIDERNENRQTKSGVYVIGDTDYNPADHAQRFGIVEWLPTHLNKKESEWDTNIELQIGDYVWFDYMMGLNCVSFIVDGVEYKYLHYNDIYVYKRNGSVSPINGYCLFSLVDSEKPDTDLIIPDGGRKDVRYGIAEYVSDVVEYRSDYWNDDTNITKGTKVIFGMPPVLLEDSLHEDFEDGSQLRISQRRYCMGYEKDGKVFPTIGHVLIKPDEEKTETEGGIHIPVSHRQKNRLGTVVSLVNDIGVKVGDRIQFFPKSATYIKSEGEDVCLIKENTITHKIF